MTADFRNLIIFEMANNHQGKLEHGMRIISEMARIAQRFGIRAAIKLQYRELDSFIHPGYKERKDIKHIPRFLDTRLSWDDFQALVHATHDRGMLSVITCFDEPSIEQALNHGADILKIASSSSMDWSLLEVLAKTGKPLICSTGGCVLADIDKLVTFLEHRNVKKLALLHCVGIYPTDDKDQHLWFMRRMMIRYPQCTIGYSGHEAPENLRVATAVIAMGAQVLERHVGVPTENVVLNAYSMNPDQVARWVSEVVATRELCGESESDKSITEVESNSMRSLMRGVWAKEKIRKGEALKPESIFMAMPVQPDQTTAKEYLATLIASRNYLSGEPIIERRPYDPIFTLRSVVHEAKGLLREARIVPGVNYEIELSHHYGIKNFRRFGAIIISIINREYCKKLIILLPGQYHPSHAHLQKEETFQILYGELDLELGDGRRKMFPGDTELIKRGEYHAFGTREGCVFEEISTTHVVGDSKYVDNKIAEIPVEQRKTKIDRW